MLFCKRPTHYSLKEKKSRAYSSLSKNAGYLEAIIPEMHTPFPFLCFQSPCISCIVKLHDTEQLSWPLMVATGAPFPPHLPECQQKQNYALRSLAHLILGAWMRGKDTHIQFEREVPYSRQSQTYFKIFIKNLFKI